MEEFDYIKEHRAGKKHGNADALSRIPCPKRDCFCREKDQTQTTAEYAVITPSPAGPTGSCKSNHVISDIQRRVSRPDGILKNEKTPDATTSGGPANHAKYAAVTAVNLGKSSKGRTDPVVKTGHNNELTLDYTTGTEMLTWSWESLRATQREDPAIGIIITHLEANAEKPDWETMSR